MIHELVEEDVTFVDLIQRHEFIWLVRLIDAAWPADHGRNAGILLEQASFRAERNLRVIVSTGECFGQGDHFLARIHF